MVLVKALGYSPRRHLGWFFGALWLQTRVKSRAQRETKLVGVVLGGAFIYFFFSPFGKPRPLTESFWKGFKAQTGVYVSFLIANQRQRSAAHCDGNSPLDKGF